MQPLIGSATGQKYNIDSMTFQITNTSILEIPANYLSAFDTIGYLSIEGPYLQSPIDQIKWDPNAFNGIKVNGFNAVNINGLIPPPAALKQLGRNGLRGFNTRIYAGENRLEKGVFKDFPSLQNIHLVFGSGGRILSIDDGAFDGLENTLEELTIDSVAMEDFPKEITKLTKLKLLGLASSDIKNIPIDTFKSFEQLTYLRFDNDDIRIGSIDLNEANENGVFLSLPKSLANLNLDGTQLNSFPKINLPNLEDLSVAGNNIKIIKKGNSGIGKSTSIGNNPIDTIEIDSILLPSNDGGLNLIGTNLVSLDLSVFDYSRNPQQFWLGFEYTNQLKTLMVSNITKIPQSVKGTIDIWFSNLEIIDKSIDDLLKTRKDIAISLLFDHNLKCENSEWLAYYAFCTPQLDIGEARCADQGGKLLEDYLKEKVPNPCDK